MAFRPSERIMDRRDRPGESWVSTKTASAAFDISARAFQALGVDPVGKVGHSYYYALADLLAMDR